MIHPTRFFSFFFQVAGIVVLTLLINAVTMKPLLNKLGMLDISKVGSRSPRYNTLTRH